jgi:hypothetical protein
MQTATRKTERILEYASDIGRSVKVDRAASVVRGVKIIGTTSKNGRDYPLPVLREARTKYEGAKVNVNHSKDGRNVRGYEERFGTIQNVRVAADGLYGDLHFNPKHAVAEQFLWDAQNFPAAAGFSHNIEGATRTERGRVFVEEIRKVHSVDLVADPATTCGLFESFPGMNGGLDDQNPLQHAIDEEILKISRNDKLNAAEKASQAKDVWLLYEKFKAKADKAAADNADDDDSAMESFNPAARVTNAEEFFKFVTR